MKIKRIKIKRAKIGDRIKFDDSDYLNNIISYKYGVVTSIDTNGNLYGTWGDTIISPNKKYIITSKKRNK